MVDITPDSARNPARAEPAELPALLDGVDVVVLRLLGGRWPGEPGLEALPHARLPTAILMHGHHDGRAE